MMDVARIQADFPILKRQVHGKRLVYLDSASSSQKPIQVLDAMDRLYRESYANVHRGVYTIAEETTALYEGARKKIANLLNAPSSNDIVFTKNVTEAINLVAYSWARANLPRGRRHRPHRDGAPRQHRAVAHPRRRARRRAALDPAHPRLPARPQRSRPPARRRQAPQRHRGVERARHDQRHPALADAAHAAGALILVDAAQAVPHLPVDVQAWDADFVGFTGHKMLGPSGIGGLWARAELLEAMPPFLGGGEMIREVTTTGFTTNDLPWKFEAGTPPIVEAVGLGAAVDYLEAIGLDAVRAHEKELTKLCARRWRDRFDDRLTIYGPTEIEGRGGAVSFLFEGIHAHDVSQVVDEDGVCVRAGHHCAKPLMRVLGVPATTRASFYVYNDEADVDALVDALAKAEAFFAI